MGLLGFLPYAPAYTLAFLVGIGLSYGLNRFFVFRTGGGTRAVVLYPLVYVVQYVGSIAIVAIWVDLLDLSPALGPVAALVLMLPVTYLLLRRLFSRDGAPEPTTGRRAT